MKRITIFLLAIFFSVMAFPNEPEETYHQILNLEGPWKMMIGDDPARALPDYDDRTWEDLYVPSNWENQGFNGYDGYAWYRKTFVLSPKYKDASLMLFLGYIDDVDEAFINGKPIGHKGSFPPDYWTAYTTERKYIIPKGLINFNGHNTIAVRVYDAQIDGGIVRGPVGIYQRHSDLSPDIDLEGYWKFHKGDDPEWANSAFKDDNWDQIAVPGIWEDQLDRDYNGFGWYRKSFKAPASKEGKRYVLMLGKIDDLDEVFINGKKVGHTGEIHNNPHAINVYDEYSRPRYYYLSEDDIVSGAVNTIAVRVFDKHGEGGIYSGPVGLIELRRFVSYWRSR